MSQLNIQFKGVPFDATDLFREQETEDDELLRCDVCVDNVGVFSLPSVWRARAEFDEWVKVIKAGESRGEGVTLVAYYKNYTDDVLKEYKP